MIDRSQHGRSGLSESVVRQEPEVSRLARPRLIDRAQKCAAVTFSNTGPMMPKAETPPITPTNRASVDIRAWRQISKGRIRFPEAPTPAPRSNRKIAEPNREMEAKTTIADTQTTAPPPTLAVAPEARPEQRAVRQDRYQQGNDPCRQADAFFQPAHQRAMHRR